jgi:NTP pyrophosphatase (non-canonical NTP hydrolase)
MAAHDDLGALRQSVAAFRDERDWRQFHSPKHLAMAIAIEAGELLEQFLWSDHDGVFPGKQQAVRDEMADVFAYLLSLADVLDVDLGQALLDKLERNALKYPANLVRGSARKYTEYRPQPASIHLDNARR